MTYLVDLARELAYLTGSTFKDLNDRCNRVCPQLQSLLQTMEALLVEEEAQRRGKRVSGR